MSDEVETIFWESEARRSKLCKSKVSHRKHFRKWFSSYLEVQHECSEHLEMAFFSFLQIFEWRNWKCFLRSKQNHQNCLSSVRWKIAFFTFLQILSEDIENVSWEIEEKRSKLFEYKIGHKKHFRKWFWSYLEIKNECSEPVKMTISIFLQSFEWRSWKRFLEKRGNILGNFSHKVFFDSSILENGSQLLFGLLRQYLQGFLNISNILNVPLEYSIVASLITIEKKNFCK